MVIVYQYIGENVLIFPGHGKWLKIKKGDQITVRKHIPCKGCSKCPGRSILIDPEIDQDICFIPNQNDWNFPLVKLGEWGVSIKETSKNTGRFIRPIEESEV